MKFGKMHDGVTDHAMDSYLLSRAAEQDLVGIADEQFGVAQSDRYRDQLKKRFSSIAEQPSMYPTVNHIRKGYRRSVCGVHSVYYRIEGESVEIMRILKNQDLAKQL